MKCRVVHTRSTLLHLLRSDCKDVQNFDHDLYDHVIHRVSRWYFSVSFKPFEEVLNTFEEICKGFFTRIDILGSLTDIGVKQGVEILPHGNVDTHHEEHPNTGRDYVCG